MHPPFISSHRSHSCLDRATLSSDPADDPSRQPVPEKLLVPIRSQPMPLAVCFIHGPLSSGRYRWVRRWCSEVRYFLYPVPRVPPQQAGEPREIDGFDGLRVLSRGACISNFTCNRSILLIAIYNHEARRGSRTQCLRRALYVY